MQPLFLTVQQAADLIQASTSFIYELVEKGMIPTRWFGLGKRRLVRIPHSDFLKWLESKDFEVRRKRMNRRPKGTVECTQSTSS